MIEGSFPETGGSTEVLKPTVDTKGVVKFSIEQGREIFKYLSALPTPSPTEAEFDPETQIYNGAEYHTLTMSTPFGSVELTGCSHGSQAVSLRVISNGNVIEVLYPPNPASSPFDGQDHLRGGDLLASPHNCADENGDNFHGTLPKTNSVILIHYPEEGLITFAFTSNLIPQNIDHSEQDGLTLVSYKLLPNGSYTKTVQIFNLGVNPFTTNQAVHPYLYIHPKDHLDSISIGNIHLDAVTLFGKGMNDKWFTNELAKAIFIKAKELMDVGDNFPAIQLFFQAHSVTLTVLEGFNIHQADIGLWSDQVRYICPEFVEFADEQFNPHNQLYPTIQPGDSSLLAVNLFAQPY